MENTATLSGSDPVEPPKPTVIDFSLEDNLSNFANIVLLIGGISAVILFFSSALITQPTLYSGNQTGFSGPGMVISVGTLLSSVATYFVLQALGSISRSLKRLAAKP